ncbi:MAG TPA: VWA domain-containing protein [Gammaproteobacteria bacterium]|nr:VWA domain-containing protein [Gammaproteobacteria bacterium]
MSDAQPRPRDRGAEAAGNPLAGRILDFVDGLRRDGFRAGVAEELDALEVAARVGIVDRRRLRWALRSLLCSDVDEWRRFDRLFDAYWQPANRRARVQAVPGVPLQGAAGQGPAGGTRPLEQEGAGEGDDSGAGSGGVQGGASERELLEKTDFRLLLDEAQMRACERLAEHLARRMRRHLLRRERIARLGRRVHMRRTIHRSLQHGGVPLELAWRRRRERLPRLVLLLDVSRSMSLYSMFFLRFARGIVAAFDDAHAFAFHTRLVPVSEALRDRDPERMRDKLAVLSLGWSGGTRIGESLARFNSGHGRLLGSRTVVVLVSDGYDTGAPELLGRELAKIHDRARRLIWLNPLLGREGYEPVAQGMQAALAHIDLFATAHNLESLAALEPELVR